MISKYRADGLAILRATEELIQNGSLTDEQKEGLTSILKQFSFWRDESKTSSRKADRAPRGKRPYK